MSGSWQEHTLLLLSLSSSDAMDETIESNAEVPLPTISDEGNTVNGDELMPDLPQNPTSPASDSSSSDSGSEDDESDQKLQLQTLQSELSTNPSNYDAHVQVIFLFFLHCFYRTRYLILILAHGHFFSI